MEEPNEPVQLPLVASGYTPEIRDGLWCVLYGLARYVDHLPDIPPYQKHRALCFEALDGLVKRYQVGSNEDITLVDDEIGELLEAFGGFLLTLYALHSSPGRDRLRLFITNWCAGLKDQIERV